MPQLPPGSSEPRDRPVRALIADAHAPTRIGLGLLLTRQPWVARCLLAVDHKESVALARRHQPEIAIVDISDVGPFAGSLTAAIRDAHPDVRIVLSSRCSVSLSARPQAFGAVAFLPAGATSEEIVATTLGAARANHANDTPYLERQDAILTDRERKVLMLLSTGATNREIGAQLNLGPDSVKKHATALYRKLGVRNRTEAAQRGASLLGTG